MGLIPVLLVPWDTLTGEKAIDTPLPAVEASANEAPVVAPFPKKFELKASDEPQTLEVKGQHFAPGLSARLETPQGYYVVTFGPRLLGNLTPTSFELTTIWSEPGTYRLVVRNRGGQRSEPIVLHVK